MKIIKSLFLLVAGIVIGALIAIRHSNHVPFRSASLDHTQGLKVTDVELVELTQRLLVEVSLQEIYLSDDVRKIIKDPGAVTVYFPLGDDVPEVISGCEFSGKREITDTKEREALSACFRSISAVEVGEGYPCPFEPVYVIRFQARSGPGVVDFMVSKHCDIVDWYFNGVKIDGSVSRFRLNSLGKAIISKIAVKPKII